MALASLILQGMGKSEEPKEKELDEYETVAAEILLAVDKRDPAMLVKSLSSFFEMCEGMPHEEEKAKGKRQFEGPLPGGWIDESEL